MIREMLLIYKIWKWHEKTFVGLPEQAQCNKLDSEIKEYIQEFENYTLSRNPNKKKFCKQKMDKEMIDVIIASINCLKYPNICEKVMVKHNINAHQRTRKGNHHVEVK